MPSETLRAGRVPAQGGEGEKRDLGTSRQTESSTSMQKGTNTKAFPGKRSQKKGKKVT